MKLSIPTILLLLAMPLSVLAWQGQDAAGNRIEVPVAGQLSVVVFIQPGQSHSMREMDDVKQVLAGSAIRPVQVVAVVSGPDARRRALAIDAKQWSWPIAIDEQYACSGQFEVNAWPTAVLFDKAGKLAGRIAGSPLSFTSRFAAYLDFAGGRITRERLDEQLAESAVVEDSTDHKAMRHLRLVDQLLAAGRTEDAQAQLRQAQELSPTAEVVRLQLVRAMLLLNQAKPADELLAAVEGKSAQAGELACLRGWAACSLERWEQAEQFLSQARKEGAPSAEVDYRLGVVYLNEGKYQEAADSLRHAYQATTRPAVAH